MITAVSAEARAAVWGWVREIHAENMYKFFFKGEAEEAVGLKYEPGWLPEETEFITKYEIMGGEVFIYTDVKELVISFTFTAEYDAETLLKVAENIKIAEE